MICFHQPWLRFRHREGAAIQMADPKPMPWRGRRGLLGQHLPLAAHSKGRTGPENTCGEGHQLSKFTSPFMPDGSTALEPPGRTAHQELLDSISPHCPEAVSMMQSRSSPACTNTSNPASEAAPHSLSKGSKLLSHLWSSTESRRYQITPDTPSHSPYRVHDPCTWLRCFSLPSSLPLLWSYSIFLGWQQLPSGDAKQSRKCQAGDEDRRGQETRRASCQC